MVKILCPKCKRGIYSDGFSTGEKVLCPNCGKGFVFSGKIKRRIPVTNPEKVLTKTGLCSLDKIDFNMLAECDVTVLGEFLLSILKETKERGSVDKALNSTISALENSIAALKQKGIDTRVSELKLKVLESIRKNSDSR